MAFRLGQAIVEFRAKGVNDVTMAANRLGKTLQAVAAGATGIRFALGAAGLAAAATGLIKLAADAQTLHVQFATLLGSASDATALLKEIDEFAAKTPFQKMDIAQAVKQFLAAGKSVGETMDMLKTLGDIAAVSGNNLNELAQVVARNSTQTTIYTKDLNELGNRGIPILKALSQLKFGNEDSVEKVRDLAAQGKLSFNDLAAALKAMTQEGGMFNNGMEKLSETVAGKFSTFVDQLTLAGTQIGNVLLPAADRLLSIMVQLTDPNGPIIGGLRDMADIFGLIAENIMNINPFLLLTGQVDEAFLINMMEQMRRRGLEFQQQRNRDAKGNVDPLADLRGDTASAARQMGFDALFKQVNLAASKDNMTLQGILAATEATVEQLQAGIAISNMEVALG